MICLSFILLKDYSMPSQSNQLDDCAVSDLHKTHVTGSPFVVSGLIVTMKKASFKEMIVRTIA